MHLACAVASYSSDLTSLLYVSQSAVSSDSRPSGVMPVSVRLGTNRKQFSVKIYLTCIHEFNMVCTGLFAAVTYSR